MVGALSSFLCSLLDNFGFDKQVSFLHEALESDERELGWTMAEAVREDVLACVDRDPACLTILEPLLFFVSFVWWFVLQPSPPSLFPVTNNLING